MDDDAPSKLDTTITENRNDPGTVAWLDLCRFLDPCDEATFEFRIPYLIKMGMELQEKMDKPRYN